MANNQNLLKGKSTQFSSTNQPANSGRRPSVLAKYIRENRVSLDDIRALISSMLAYDVEEIQSVLKDKKGKPPATIILILRSIIADMKKGEITNLEKLLDRAYGKPEKTINHEIGAMTPEALSQLNIIFAEMPTPKPGAKPSGKPNEQKPRAKRKSSL